MKGFRSGGAVSVYNATTRGPKKCCLQNYSIGSAFGFFGNWYPSHLRLKICSSIMIKPDKITQASEVWK